MIGHKGSEISQRPHTHTPYIKYLAAAPVAVAAAARALYLLLVLISAAAACCLPADTLRITLIYDNARDCASESYFDQTSRIEKVGEFAMHLIVTCCYMCYSFVFYIYLHICERAMANLVWLVAVCCI